MASFELFIAARYLRAKRRQAVIGVITAISVLGVAAGVASLIVALAVNNGFRQDLQERLVGSMAHVNLMRTESDGIKNYRELASRLAHMPHVVADASAMYPEVLISRGGRAKGAILKGIIPEQEKRVSKLLDSVKIGSYAALEQAQKDGEARRAASQNENATLPTEPKSGDAVNDPSSMEGLATRFGNLPPIVLGKDMATDLGATVGSVVLVTSPQGELTPFGIVPRYARFKVVGVFQSGAYDYDSTWALISLYDAQRLESVGDMATVIEFKLDDIYKAAEVGEQLEKEAGKGYMTSNWMEQNKAMFHALRLERVVTFITIGLIVFVAALNILISLIMMVMEKTKDIAVLSSMGAKRGQIRRIFIYQGLLIGVIGTVIGLIVGYTLSYLAGRYHWVSLSAEVYSMDYVPFAPRAIDGVLVALVSLFISFVATIYPSRSAAKVLPAEALRYE
jgi:lipoprotein-releasing system permease protein